MSITEAPRLSFPKCTKQKGFFFPMCNPRRREKSLDRASEQKADTKKKKAPLANNSKLLKNKKKYFRISFSTKTAVTRAISFTYLACHSVSVTEVSVSLCLQHSQPDSAPGLHHYQVIIIPNISPAGATNQEAIIII